MTSNGAAVKRRRTENGNGNGESEVTSSQVQTSQLNGNALRSRQRTTEVKLKMRLKNERRSIVLWKSPILTTKYFILEMNQLVLVSLKRIFANKKNMLSIFLVIMLMGILWYLQDHTIVQTMWKNGRWYLYWIGLGVLSSVGLGTGLHTFLLYLGPHITSVTLAAYECGSLNFLEPPYPEQIICPEEFSNKWATSMWTILMKVKWESMMWGAGTALGELPPYFMARAAQMSGYNSEDEDDELKEFEELQKKAEEDPSSMTYIESIKLRMEKFVKSVGFFGILACASIPNPLFDLAGITCGHFRIPFWTFFGATLIGKAVIKMLLQVMFVIIAFEEGLVKSVLAYVGYVPIVGAELQPLLIQFFDNQKKRLHSKDVNNSSPSTLAWIFEYLIVAMVGYFIVSLINTMAQNYHKRINKHR